MKIVLLIQLRQILLTSQTRIMLTLELFTLFDAFSLQCQLENIVLL